MHYIWQHINTIIDTYDGKLPLAHFIRQYGKQYPILGSRDRRLLSEMAYSYYRCAKGVAQQAEADTQRKNLIKACLQLCGSEQALHWLFKDESPVEVAFSLAKLFPHDLALTEGVDCTEWLASMLVQPDLFIRVRKDKAKITAILRQNNIPFTELTEGCLALPNGTKIDKLLPAENYVVQDASSQSTGHYLAPRPKETWYDCCSGAGGKSLLLKDLEPSIQLTISDVRESIIHNLQDRFRLYGHQQPRAIVANIADAQNLMGQLKGQQFDHIICDAPCSGSGTWARTPEQLYFFAQQSLEKFTTLQINIATNVSAYLKPGGRLIYITCSVFSKENEEVVARVLNNTKMSLLESRLISGISIHADSMFVAVLQKPTL